MIRLALCLCATAAILAAGCVSVKQVERSRNRVDFKARSDYEAVQKVIHEKSLVMVPSVWLGNMNVIDCTSDPQTRSGKVISYMTNGMTKQVNMVVTITQESDDTCNVAVCTLTGIGSSKNWAAPAVEKWLRDAGLLIDAEPAGGSAN